MSTEINRRDFMKIVFSTASAAALARTSVIWPANAVSRPLAEPFTLTVDGSGYLIDPSFDYCDVRLPTHRQHLSLEGLEGKDLKLALDDQVYAFEHVVSDPDNWSLDEVEAWLDTEIEFDDLGPWQAAQFGPYNVGLEIYESLSGEEAANLGLYLVEGEHPGSSFTAVAFHGNLDKLNRELEIQGMNMVVTTN